MYLEHGGSDLTKLFQAQSHNEEWQRLQLPVGRIPSSYHVVVEASSSGNPLEIIAVDELVLANCYPPAQCNEVPEGYLMCENQACFPAEALCDLTDDCGDYTDEVNCGKYCRRPDKVCGCHHSC